MANFVTTLLAVMHRKFKELILTPASGLSGRVKRPDPHFDKRDGI